LQLPCQAQAPNNPVSYACPNGHEWDIEFENGTSSLRTHCRFSNSVSSDEASTSSDASRLTRCHLAAVSYSCHFFPNYPEQPWLQSTPTLSYASPALYASYKTVTRLRLPLGSPTTSTAIAARPPSAARDSDVSNLSQGDIVNIAGPQ
jgi:hypothetical protein